MPAFVSRAEAGAERWAGTIVRKTRFSPRRRITAGTASVSVAIGNAARYASSSTLDQL